MQKESNLLRKGAGKSNLLKWGLAEMVLWSAVDGPVFLVFFAVQFCKLWENKKRGGNLPTGPPTSGTGEVQCHFYDECFGCDQWVSYILVFEEHCVAHSHCLGFHDVDVEVLVVFHCRPDVETGVCVDVPGLSVLGLDVGHHHVSQVRKGAFHVIVLPMDMGICRHFWCNVALLQ